VKGALDEKLPSDIELVDVKEEDTDYVNPRGVRFVQDGPNGWCFLFFLLLCFAWVFLKGLKFRTVS